MSAIESVAPVFAYLLPNPDLASPDDIEARNAIGLGGLRALDGRAFPLERVKVRASLAGPCAHTTVEQHFVNPFDETLDVTWIFPLPDSGALVSLELRSGDIVIDGECKEREEARLAFDKARSEGKRTALVERGQGNVHTLSLAGLPSKSDVTVKLTLVELLPSIDGRYRWHFPTTIAPRYTPGTPVGHDGDGVSPDTDFVPNASRLSPPMRIGGGTQLDLEVEVAGPLSLLESSLHAVKLSLGTGGARVAPKANATLNKDFILEYSTADSVAPATRAWTDGTHTLVVLEPPSGIAADGLPRDAVFTIDISGSMGGLKMEAAKAALRGALHGLRSGDRFKLIAFDDRVERFARDFSVYDDRSLAAADRWIDALDARGGTEMLAAIQESLDGVTPAGRLRTVLFITDGQSNDESRLLPAIVNRKGNAVVFTLGIDTAVNASLLKALASAGGGVCELCTPTDDIDAVVARLEARFGSPLLSELKVAGAARPDGQTVFTGRPAMLLLDSAPATVEVTGTGAQGAFVANVAPLPLSFPLGALWAMERVSWLEERLVTRPFEEEAIRPEILRVALQWKIASKFTAFVCVDHTHTTSGERRHVVQPTEVPEAWEILADQQGLSGGTMSMPAPPLMARYSMQHIAESELDDTAEYEAPGHASISYSRPMAASPIPEAPMPGSIGGASAAFRDALGGLFRSRSNKSQRADAAPAQSCGDDVAGVLARSQMADGSFGGEIGRTAAALLVLLLVGNTRRKGDRRRTVQKAAEWLARNTSDETARMALEALVKAEAGDVSPTVDWGALTAAGTEGDMLRTLLDAGGFR